MNEQTQPTDAEILDAADDFRSQYKHGGTTFDEFNALGFARAVLAKWGTPAGAGEVVGWMWQHEETGRTGFVDCWQVENGWQENNPRLRLVSKLFTTPQPTQAQAGAPRVSPEQWQALFDDQKRLVELANSRADIAESMLKAVQVQAGTDAVVEEVANGLRRYGLTLVKTASGYDVLNLREVAAHDTKGADHA